jgi:bacteriorhodopsin
LNCILTGWYSLLSCRCLIKGNKNGSRSQKACLVHGIVCLVNQFCYALKMANLDTIIIDGRPVAYLRYVEWTIGSPLMLMEIAITMNMPSLQMTQPIVLTVAFCICGTISAISQELWVKIYLGIQGTVFFLLSMYIVWNHYITTRKNTQKSMKLGLCNLVIATSVWPMYIVTWGLGPDVYHVISRKHENLAETIASTFLKTSAMTYSFDVEGVESTLDLVTTTVSSVAQ